METKGAACLGESLSLGKRVKYPTETKHKITPAPPPPKKRDRQKCAVKRCGWKSWRRARPASPSGASSQSSWSTCQSGRICPSYILISPYFLHTCLEWSSISDQLFHDHIPVMPDIFILLILFRADRPSRVRALSVTDEEVSS